MEIEVTPRYHLAPLKITLRKSCGGWNEMDRFSISLVALKIKYSPLGEQYDNIYKDMPHPWPSCPILGYLSLVGDWGGEDGPNSIY